MESVVLDAARAIEGHQSIESLERLQGRGGLPDGETLMRVRVAGLTPRLFGVTDGKAVLYRGAHDGYVWAYGAWPFPVDVELGLAAVSYSGSASETDSTGDSRTGLLGCRCVSGGELRLLCATAPYVAHVDDDPASLNASAVHVIAFPGLSMLGMSCDNTAVRVLPLRWPRRRLATAEGNGGSGYAGYQRASFLNVAQRVKGDTDATDNLRLLAHKFTATQAGAVEAAIFVQPLCSHGSNPACWRDAQNCYPWCMGVVRGGVRAQNVSMYSAQRWEDHVVMPDVDNRHNEQGGRREREVQRGAHVCTVPGSRTGYEPRSPPEQGRACECLRAGAGGRAQEENVACRAHPKPAFCGRGRRDPGRDARQARSTRGRSGDEALRHRPRISPDGERAPHSHKQLARRQGSPVRYAV